MTNPSYVPSYVSISPFVGFLLSLLIWKKTEGVENITFNLPGNVNSSIKINHKIMEVKVKSEYFDKSQIEKLLNLKESRFSKYCIGINRLYDN